MNNEILETIQNVLLDEMTVSHTPHFPYCSLGCAEEDNHVGSDSAISLSLLSLLSSFHCQKL